VLAAPLGIWLFALLALSAFAALLPLVHGEFHAESLAPCSHSLGQIQQSTRTSAVGVRLQFAVYDFQFCWVGGVQSAQGLH
jgi:hypothetical protein